MDNIYARIMLESTSDFSNKDDRIHKEKELVENIMREKQIDYALEIIESSQKETSIINIEKKYTLYLIIRKIDLDYVIKLLDQHGDIGYFVIDESKDDITKNEINEGYLDDIESESFWTEENENLEETKKIDSEDSYNIKPSKNVDYYICCFSEICFFICTLFELNFVKQDYELKDYETLIASLIIVVILVLLIIFIDKKRRFYKNKENED